MQGGYKMAKAIAQGKHRGRAASMGTVRDIAEKKREEEDLLKFKLGLERSNDAVFITDIDGAITYVNPAFEKLYGFRKEEALGKTPRIIKSGTFPDSAYKQFWDTLLAKKVVSGEILNKAKDGRLVTVEGSANPILDSNGNITGFLAIQRDITERKKAEDELGKLNERLRVQIAELERFNRLTVGRELKMIELKKRLRELEEKNKRVTQK